jgi:hypothetical protein
MDIRLELIMLAVGGIAGGVIYACNLLHQIAGDLRRITRQLECVVSVLERRQ